MTIFAPLVTDRLILRPYRLADAPNIQRYAGDNRVATMTARTPHPYPDGAAETWIAEAARMMDAGEGWPLAMATRGDDALIGSVGLERDEGAGTAELGYWVAVPAWGRGYATEAARRLVAFGFTALDLGEIHAHALAENLASRRVLEKAGLSFDGLATVDHRGRNVSAACYAITRERWSASG